MTWISFQISSANSEWILSRQSKNKPFHSSHLIIHIIKRLRKLFSSYFYSSEVFIILLFRCYNEGIII